MNNKILTQSLFSASVITLVANGLGRFVGFFREAVIADHYGTSSLLDTFIIAFTAPELISFIVYAALPTAIIAFQKNNSINDSSNDDRRIFWTGLAGFTLVLAVVWLIIWMFKVNIIDWIAPDLTQAHQLLSYKLLYILAPFLFFRGLEAYMRGWLFKKKHFLVPALTPFILNAGILSAIFILHDKINILALAYGWLSGAIMIFIFNGLLAMKVINGNAESSETAASVRKLFQLAFTIGIVEAISFAYPFVDRLFATRFLGEGQIAALRYSAFLMQVAPGVLIVTFTTASFPWISDFSQKDKLEQLKKLYTRSIGLILYVITPVAIGMILFSQEIVQLAFMRGAFDLQSVNLTVGPFVAYSLGLIFFSVYTYQLRLYYARQMILRLGMILLIMLAVKIITSYLLVIPYEQNGLAYATSLAWLTGFVCMTGDLAKMMGGWVFRSLVNSIGRVLPLSGFLIIAWLLADYIWPAQIGTAPIWQLIRLLLMASGGISLYLIVSRIFKIAEFMDMSETVRSKLNRGNKI